MSYMSLYNVIFLQNSLHGETRLIGRPSAAKEYRFPSLSWTLRLDTIKAEATRIADYSDTQRRHRHRIGADKILTLRYSKTTARPPTCSRMHGTCCTQNLAMATDGRGPHLCVPYGCSPVRRWWRPTFFLSDRYGNELRRFSHRELSPRHRGMRST